MNPAEERDESVDLHGLPDEELIRRCCASPPDREAFEELARRCLPKLQKAIKPMVFAKKSICPQSCDRQAFLDDCVSSASELFVRRISTFGFRGSFDGWLYRLARNAALDEHRKIVGRGAVSRTLEPEEAPEHAPSPGPALPAPFLSKYWTDPFEIVRDREHREIVTTLLTAHAQESERTAESAWAIKLRVWEDCPAREIAEKRGSSERDVWRLFADDYRKLRQLLVGKFGIATVRHV
jgi:RNA polymerase sigma factor (sigma-70 family)